VVGQIITCDAGVGTGMVMNEGESTVVVNTSTGLIEKIISGVPEDDDIYLIRFPPDCTLLPGFIDCHVHLTITTDDYQVDQLKRSSSDKALKALKVAHRLLQAGFTTLRTAGDADQYYPTFAVAKSINSGDFDGPRIVGAGHYISVTVSKNEQTVSPTYPCACLMSCYYALLLVTYSCNMIHSILL
jgi:imidazolonepropionase-like amidohydrolase